MDCGGSDDVLENNPGELGGSGDGGGSLYAGGLSKLVESSGSVWSRLLVNHPPMRLLVDLMTNIKL